MRAKRTRRRQVDVGQIEEAGFAIFADVIELRDLRRLAEALGGDGVRRSRAGVRHALQYPAVAELARHEALMEIARESLRGAQTPFDGMTQPPDRGLSVPLEPVPFRATLFDKSARSNWLVVWHQDTALPLREKTEREGWGPWSVKDGVTYAHAPAAALERVVALRVHLDDSTPENGPLRVLPGTHRMGVLNDEEIQQLARHVAPVECCVGRGGVVMMRPLVVHASSKSRSADPRRVLHIEYAAAEGVADGLRVAIA